MLRLRPRPTAWLLLATVAFGPLAPLRSGIAQRPPGQLAAASPRCDEDLVEFDGLLPVFVRMRSQLLPDGEAWPAFQREHAGADRRTLRTEVVHELQQRAAQSWSAVAERVSALEESGRIVDPARFWIVNGFACDADSAAVEELLALDEVAFVHRQRQPGRSVQHRRRNRPVPPATRRQRAAAFERALEATTEDRAEAPFDPEGLTIPWNVQKVRAPEAWARGADGSGVVIAMMDSGLLPTPALERALWRNPAELPNGEDDDGDGRIDDLFGWDLQNDSKLCLGDGRKSHGTMCAGVMVGRETPGAEGVVTGIAPRARLMVLRGTGRLEGYEYAALHGADVLSMSYTWIGFELGSYRGVFRTAHEHLAACGVVAVGGAGNYGTSKPTGEQIALPKDIPCVLAAAGVHPDGEVPPWSSRGPIQPWADVPFFRTAEQPLKPDLTACNGGFPLWHHTTFPGRKVRVFRSFGPEDDPEPVGLIVGPRGNSFAGPHVAGAAALLLSACPETPSWKVAELLTSTAEDLGPPGHDPIHGHGLLRCDAALEAAAARD